MKKKTSRLLSILLVLCMVLAVLPGTALAAGAYQIKLSGVYDYDGAYEVLELLNSYRREKGLSQLVMDKDLLATGMQRAAETAIYFDHTRPDGSSCFTSFPAKFTRGTVRENIAAGQSSPAGVMNSWKNSSGHNANMLGNNNSSVGIGAFVDSKGTRYWVQVFSSVAGTAEASRTAGRQAVTANVAARADMLDIIVSPSSASLKSGETATFTASNRNTDWSYATPNIHFTYAVSESPRIATVSIGSDGKAVVTAVGGGTTTVKLGVDGAVPITVSIPVTVSGPSAPSGPKVMLSPQKLTVNGKPVECEKYNINGENYFKLRDLALMLNGTGSQFGVGYDNKTNTVTVTTGAAYTAVGGELAAGADNSATAQSSAQTIIIDGRTRGDLTVYNIGGSNFFRLRDLGTALGFEVGYDALTNTATVRSK